MKPKMRITRLSGVLLPKWPNPEDCIIMRKLRKSKENGSSPLLTFSNLRRRPSAVEYCIDLDYAVSNLVLNGEGETFCKQSVISEVHCMNANSLCSKLFNLLIISCWVKFIFASVGFRLTASSESAIEYNYSLDWAT